MAICRLNNDTLYKYQVWAGDIFALQTVFNTIQNKNRAWRQEEEEYTSNVQLGLVAAPATTAAAAASSSAISNSAGSATHTFPPASQPLLIELSENSYRNLLLLLLLLQYLLAQPNEFEDTRE